MTVSWITGIRLQLQNQAKLGTLGSNSQTFPMGDNNKQYQMLKKNS